MRWPIPFCLTLVLPILMSCSNYKATETEEQLSVLEVTPEMIIQQISQSDRIIVELTVTFAEANPLVSRMITASLNFSTGNFTVDNSAIERQTNDVVNSCRNSYGQDVGTELVDFLPTLVSGGSNRVNADGLNYELSISDLNGNSVRQYLAGSPMAAGQLLLFLNSEDFVARLMEVGTCP